MHSDSRPVKAKLSAGYDRCAAPRGSCSAGAPLRRAPGQGGGGAQLVITRAQGEDLRWLDALPELPAVVYNRLGLDEFLPTPRPNLLLVRQDQDPVLSKLGPEDGMLRHIIAAYNQLPELTIFLQGWPFGHCADARDIVARSILNAHRPSDADFLWNGAEAGLVPLTSTFYQYDIGEGKLGSANELIRTDPSFADTKIANEVLASMAFNKTCSKLLQRPCNLTMWVAEGSQWTVSRERIKKTPKAVYERLLEAPTGSQGRMKEVVLEALWPMMWGAPAWTPGMLPMRSSPVMNLQVKTMVESMNHYCVFSTDGGREKGCEEDAGYCLYSKLAGGVADAEGPVELRPPRRGAELSGLCPAGYAFDDGNAPGNDQFGRDAFNLKATIQQCADDCDHQEECLSFEWSATSKTCNLNKVADPTSARIKDFVFCRSNSVKSEVADVAPERKVAAYLEGRMSAPRAREIYAREMQTDLLLRLSSAFARDSAAQLDRRMYCSQRHLSAPSLAIVNKKWQLLSVGYPYYRIQAADFTNCLADTGSSKRQTIPCSSNKPGMRWELRKVTAGGFQLVSQHGKCLARTRESVSVSNCEPDDERQVWQLDMERIGTYYEKMSLQMVESAGRLQMRCVSQLNNQTDLVTPPGMHQSQIVHWRIINASANHGEGAYFLARQGADGHEAYLSCKGTKKKAEVVLQPKGFPWHLREGEDGRVIMESDDKLMLQYDHKHGSLSCLSASDIKEGSRPPSSVMFALAVPGRAARRGL